MESVPGVHSTQPREAFADAAIIELVRTHGTGVTLQNLKELADRYSLNLFDILENTQTLLCDPLQCRGPSGSYIRLIGLLSHFHPAYRSVYVSMKARRQEIDENRNIQGLQEIERILLSELGIIAP